MSGAIPTNLQYFQSLHEVGGTVTFPFKSQNSFTRSLTCRVTTAVGTSLWSNTNTFLPVQTCQVVYMRSICRNSFNEKDLDPLSVNILNQSSHACWIIDSCSLQLTLFHTSTELGQRKLRCSNNSSISQQQGHLGSTTVFD